MPSISQSDYISDEELSNALNGARGKIDLLDLVPLSFSFKGGPLDIANRRPMFSELFRSTRTPRKDVYLCGRQLGKTVSIGGNIAMNSTWRKDFTTIYIAPLALYTQRLNSMFLMPMLRGCLLPWPIQNTKDCTNNVLEKSFLTGSRYIGISTYSTANQALGITGDWVLFDETQDMNADLIPQIKEVIGTSDYRYESYFGTARSVENTLSILYENSTQKVAHVKCTKCGKVNIPNLEHRVFDMIQKHGIACIDCKELLNVSSAQWIRTYEYDQLNRDTEGYHIPQIMVEDRIKPYDRYVETIYNKLHGTNAYSETKFLQEVLGIPTSQGGMPITQKDIQEACVLDIEADTRTPPGRYHAIAGGADWGGSEVTSFTVGVVLGYMDGKFDVLGATRPTGLPDEIRHIAVADYMTSRVGDRIDLIGADAGFVGSVQNPNLSQYTGIPVASICYGTTKRFLVPHVNNNFTVDRTTLIFIVLTLIKQKKIRFPKGGWFGAFTRDIMAIYTEDVVSHNGSTLRRYSRYSDRPDDFVHALGYALLVCALKAHIDLPSMVGMSIDSSLTAPYIKYTGHETGQFGGGTMQSF